MWVVNHVSQYMMYTHVGCTDYAVCNMTIWYETNYTELVSQYVRNHHGRVLRIRSKMIGFISLNVYFLIFIIFFVAQNLFQYIAQYNDLIQNFKTYL